MDVDHQDLDSPPELEEGYWESLLREGEHATTVEPDYFAFGDQERAFVESDNGLHAHDIASSCSEDWVEVTTVYEADEVVELSVIGYNRGGLLVEWKRLHGFVPASQLIEFPSTAPSSIRRSALINRVGQRLKLRVIELNVENNRLILSERAATAEPGQRDVILSSLQTGDVIEGCVTNLCDFGAFIDLGGLEGLIHISELSWGRVGHPSQMLKRDERVKAYVLGVDAEESRVALSLKRLRDDPWKTVEERYEIGQVVEGIITNVVDFGAFACIEEGLEGLIHVSELAEGQFLHPRNVVSEGQTVHAKILNINGSGRRLGLTLRVRE